MAWRLRRPAWIGLATAAGTVVLDQLSKGWILSVVMQPPRVIEITPFFNLVLGWNTGISFGLLGGNERLSAWFLPVVAAAVVVLLAIWLARAERGWMGISLGLIIGGAVGNIIDRLRFGAVADFLDFHAFGFHWPAFNIADSAITMGAAVMIISSLFERSETHAKMRERGDLSS